MRRTFTFIELTIGIAIIAIIAAMAIPNLNESRDSINYKEIVGQTIMWNGHKTLITSFEYSTYTVVIMPTSGGAVIVKVDRDFIVKAYKESVVTPEKSETVKVEQ
jgi:prepilin-type N-terminal cleavage/methylation domain-containing protein